MKSLKFKKKQRTKSNKQRTKSNKQRTKSNKQRTKSNKQRTKYGGVTEEQINGVVNDVFEDIKWGAFNNKPKWFILKYIRKNIHDLAARNSFYLTGFTPQEKKKVIWRVHDKHMESLKESDAEVE